MSVIFVCFWFFFFGGGGGGCGVIGFGLWHKYCEYYKFVDDQTSVVLWTTYLWSCGMVEWLNPMIGVDVIIDIHALNSIRVLLVRVALSYRPWLGWTIPICLIGCFGRSQTSFRIKRTGLPFLLILDCRLFDNKPLSHPALNCRQWGAME